MHDDDDDLGPALKLSVNGSGFARAAVEQWLIQDVGRRPRDFMARDLLVASLLRDPRQWLYRCLSADLPAWIGRHIADIGDKRLRKVACQIAALHFVHAIHLHRLSENLDEPHQAIVARLQQCVPYGLLLNRSGYGPPDGRDICDLARQCPWCLARRVTEVYERLHALHREDIPGVFFVARVNLSDEAFAVSGTLTLREQCRLVRERLGTALIRDARAIGAEGGLVTFAVGPRLSGKWTGCDQDSDPMRASSFASRCSARFRPIGDKWRCY